MNCFPKEDVLHLSTSERNFDQKRRGKRNNKAGIIPEESTRRQCVRKIAEIFDLTGKITPIVAEMKLDLRGSETTKQLFNVPDILIGGIFLKINRVKLIIRAYEIGNFRI